MDYIERIFSVSPDAGNGSLELLILTFCLISAVSLLAGRIAHLKRKRRRKVILAS